MTFNKFIEMEKAWILRGYIYNHKQMTDTQ